MSRFTIATVVEVGQSLIKAVATANKDLVDEVEEGAVVKAVYIELWLLNSSNDGSDIVVLHKAANNQGGPSFTEMNALSTYTEKKNVLFTHQGLSSNNGVGNPVVVMRGWYKIPKSKQRFGLGDRLNLIIANNGPSTLEACGFCTYKEYT